MESNESGRKNTTGARRSWKLLIGGNQYHSLKNDDELLIGGEDEYDVPPKKPLDKTKRRTFGELLQKQYQDKSSEKVYQRAIEFSLVPGIPKDVDLALDKLRPTLDKTKPDYLMFENETCKYALLASKFGLSQETKRLLKYCCENGALLAASAILHREPTLIRTLPISLINFAVKACVVFEKNVVSSLLEQIAYRWSPLKIYFAKLNMLKSLDALIAAGNRNAHMKTMDPGSVTESENAQTDSAHAPKSSQEDAPKPPKRIYNTQKNRASRIAKHGVINGVARNYWTCAVPGCLLADFPYTTMQRINT